jgi:RNA polymerase sigma factor (sigma-70 family)
MAVSRPSTRDRLFEEHLGLVRAIARRYARPGGEPLEDLVQVGAIGLLKAIDRFDRRRGRDLRAFAAPTIEGEIRHHLRDRGRTDGRAVPLDGRDAPAPQEALDERALVAAGLDTLSGRERRIVELRYLEDRRQADIAKEVGLSQAQVSRTLQRALQRMRDALGAPEAAAAPPPRKPGSHSGRVLVRMEPDLHRRLAGAAEDAGVSLNALVTDALREAVDKRRPRALLVANLIVIAAALAVGVVLLAGALANGW